MYVLLVFVVESENLLVIIVDKNLKVEDIIIGIGVKVMNPII